MATTAKPTPSWRDVLPIHPACAMFDLLPPDELRALGEDIRKNGLTSPIAVTVTKLPIGWHYELLDGRNRLDAMELVGIHFTIERNKGSCFLDLTDSGIRVDDIRRLAVCTRSISHSHSGATTVSSSIISKEDTDTRPTSERLRANTRLWRWRKPTTTTALLKHFNSNPHDTTTQTRADLPCAPLSDATD